MVATATHQFLRPPARDPRHTKVSRVLKTAVASVMNIMSVFSHSVNSASPPLSTDASVHSAAVSPAARGLRCHIRPVESNLAGVFLAALLFSRGNCSLLYVPLRDYSCNHRVFWGDFFVLFFFSLSRFQRAQSWRLCELICE